MRLLFCLLFLISFDLPAAQQIDIQKKKKIASSHTQKIGEKLTRTNALFPRSETNADNARTLFIMLDEDEAFMDEIGAITEEAIHILLERAGPILISSNLLCNIFRGPFDPDSLSKMQGMLKKSAGKPVELDEELLVFSIFTMFDPQEWLIKIVKNTDDLLFLLIPKWYIESKKKGFSGEDFSLNHCIGLRLSSMDAVTDSKDEWAERWKSEKPSKHKVAVDFFVQPRLFSPLSMFMLDRDYTEDYQALKPQWNFVLSGHGAEGVSIANFTLEQFRKFFAFISKKLVTKSFIYSSCYASKMSMTTAYSEGSYFMGHADNEFPIISIGASEAEASSSEDIWLKNVSKNNMTLDFGLDMRKFVENAEKSAPVPYETLLSSIIYGFSFFADQHEGRYPVHPELFAGNYPLIRFPHRKEFLPILPTVEINERMVVGRSIGGDTTLPLDIKKYAQQKIAQQLNIPISKLDFTLESQRLICILLSAPYIPFQVDFIDASYISTQQYEPIVISTAIGTASEGTLHIFERVKSNYTLDLSLKAGILGIFGSLGYATQRTYLIRKLTVIEEDKSKKKETEYTNVLIHFQPNPEQITTYYTLNDGIKYKSIFPASAKAIKEDYLEAYANAIATIKKQYDDELKKASGISGAITKVIKDPAEVKKRSNAMLEARGAAEEAEKKKKLKTDKGK